MREAWAGRKPLWDERRVLRPPRREEACGLLGGLEEAAPAASTAAGAGGSSATSGLVPTICMPWVTIGASPDRRLVARLRWVRWVAVALRWVAVPLRWVAVAGRWRPALPTLAERWVVGAGTLTREEAAEAGLEAGLEAALRALAP